jgi:hypothetical protein
MSPEAQYDTSNGNWMKNNQMAKHPSGVTQPNGVDFWWDEQGTGNCWEGNTSANGTITSNSTNPLGLPTCASGGSLAPIGNVVKSAGLVPCSEYNREDNPDPIGCDWFDNPTPPAGRQAAPGQPAVPAAADAIPGITLAEAAGFNRAPAPSTAGGGLAATGGPMTLALLGVLGSLGLLIALDQRRKA